MSKKILCMVSEWGYWGEELVGPYDVLIDHGYEIDFMTAKGRKPPVCRPAWRRVIGIRRWTRW